MTFRAVIFDLGGVVFPSPFDVFAAYERDHGLPDRFIRGVVAASADHGAWARLERSELSFDEFCVAFEAECAAAGGTVDAADLMREIGRGFAPRPAMVQAIRRSARTGLQGRRAHEQLGAEHDRRPTTRRTRSGTSATFDVVVESAVEGLRKPDPRIYELVCERLGVTPAEACSSTTSASNLKPARALGMTTIKVDRPGRRARRARGRPRLRAGRR